MLLTSHEPRVDRIELRPVRYQFGSVRGDYYDDNWLIITGAVATEAGRWSFTEPALLVDEARKLARWLRRAAGGWVPVSEPAADGELSPDLHFLEPLVAFSLADRAGDRLVLRVHLSLEAAPPWQPDDDGDEIHQFAIEIPCDAAALTAAADAWSAELAAFPAR
ncbi:WapI family immunity protein [Kitasatospora acidiphila]|uniref:WapI family immunity protein n=1 Tax=Kitasatospora acidiphila TaxID=2567942 RepID=UPI003C76584D